MENDLKQQILSIIEMAEAAYLNNLDPSNPNAQGYPYVAGYANSALSNIRDLVEAA